MLLRENAMKTLNVELQDLEDQLGRYVEQVKSGSTLVITEQGTPVGRFLPVEGSTSERLKHLVESGRLGWSGRKLRPIRPVTPVRGVRSVADLLLEDRD
jgi:prevent-host-death family protein